MNLSFFQKTIQPFNTLKCMGKPMQHCVTPQFRTAHKSHSYVTEDFGRSSSLMAITQENFAVLDIFPM